ncbi:MAG: ParB/RepB/Spo0J family partition protein, partial [Actinomycetota bacterium]|nr:ParB/RepB/Spo0J family partition protein [Actinomycetota bacterium]
MAQKRTGLGRGIGALIPGAPTTGERPVDVFFPSASETANLVSIPGASLAALSPAAIRPNPQQPRKEFHQEELNELIHSVTEFGVLQPIVVRPLAKPEGPIRYELIMGERRLRAATAAGLATIPAVVRETEDDAMLRDALLENLHRANLNALEEASAYQQLLSDFGITQDELATKLGRSRPQVTNTLRLLRLPADVQKKVAAGVLSAGHAR